MSAAVLDSSTAFPATSSTLAVDSPAPTNRCAAPFHGDAASEGYSPFSPVPAGGNDVDNTNGLFLSPMPTEAVITDGPTAVVSSPTYPEMVIADDSARLLVYSPGIELGSKREEVDEEAATGQNECRKVTQSGRSVVFGVPIGHDKEDGVMRGGNDDNALFGNDNDGDDAKAPLLPRGGGDDDDAGNINSNGGGDGKYDGEAQLLNTDNDKPPMRSAFFTMFPVFMAYAALVTLQGDLKAKIGISNNDDSRSGQFSFAVSLCYLGNLIFRLLHNIFFAMFTPRQRVYISYICLITAVGMIAVVYYWLNWTSIVWVYFIYLLGGVGIGTFESNLISVITPLGHATKKWAQLGISIGFNGIAVGAFILFAIFPRCDELQGAVYSAIAVSNIFGLLFFKFGIPDIHFEASAKDLRGFWEDVKAWKQWAPKLLLHAFSLMVDMFCVSFASAIQQYIYTSNNLPLFTIGPAAKAAATIPKNVHRSVFNFASLVGDAAGRKIAYSTKKHVNPLFFLLASALGVFLILSKQPLLAPFGMLFVMFANGSIYAFTTKFIDDYIPRGFNLIGLSFWLFVGDAGSFTGANVVNPIRDLIGSD